VTELAEYYRDRAAEYDAIYAKPERQDDLAVPGSNTPISRTSDDGDTVQHRTLNDGRGFEIVKNFPAREQFATDVAGITATPVEWTELTYFWLATFQVHAPASSSASAT
jgi:hypothetical protein